MKHNIPIIGTSIWYQIDNRSHGGTIESNRIDVPSKLDFGHGEAYDYLTKTLGLSGVSNVMPHHIVAEHENCVRVTYVQKWSDGVAYFSSDELTVSRKPFKIRTVAEQYSDKRLFAWLFLDSQINSPYPHHCHRSFDLPISPDMLPAPGKLELKISSIAGEFRLNISGYLQVDTNRTIRQQATEAVASELEEWQSNLAQHLNKQRAITEKLKYENK